MIPLCTVDLTRGAVCLPRRCAARDGTKGRARQKTQKAKDPNVTTERIPKSN
jgi:hypothetical protein